MTEYARDVTDTGAIEIPPELRDELNIHAPGRVTIELVDDGLLIKPVPLPKSVSGELEGVTDDQGRTGGELLREMRQNDARIEDQRVERYRD